MNNNFRPMGYISVVAMNPERAKRFCIEFLEIPEHRIDTIEDAGPAKPRDSAAWNRWKEGAREYHITLTKVTGKGS